MPETLKQNKLKIVALISLTGTILVWSFYLSLPDQKLHLKVYDVGQGDAIFLRSSTGFTALFDGGPNGKVVNRLAGDIPFYSKKIDLVVLTHPDADHLTGLLDVVKQYEVGEVWINGDKKDTRVFQEWEKILADLKLNVRIVKAGDELRIGENFHLRVVWPPKDFASSHANLRAIVVKLSYGSFDSLLTADADKSVQPYTSNIGHLEVLKVPHHGSKEAMSETFLSSTSPEVSLISVGTKNSYGHPTPFTLNMIAQSGSKLYRTDKDGTIEIVSDGHSWYTSISDK